jgi:hypothetical protein
MVHGINDRAAVNSLLCACVCFVCLRVCDFCACVQPLLACFTMASWTDQWAAPRDHARTLQHWLQGCKGGNWLPSVSTAKKSISQFLNCCIRQNGIVPIGSLHSTLTRQESGHTTPFCFPWLRGTTSPYICQPDRMKSPQDISRKDQSQMSTRSVV